MDDDDEDFADMFADFNESPDVSELAERISDNLRAQAGIGGKTVVHEGEADEGRITWQAPARSGLHNARTPSEEVEDSLWDELAPDDAAPDGSATAISENILSDGKAAVEAMDRDEAAEVATLFDKLAAHGKGFALLDAEEFAKVLMALAKDERGQKLLRILMAKMGR